MSKKVSTEFRHRLLAQISPGTSVSAEELVRKVNARQEDVLDGLAQLLLANIIKPCSSVGLGLEGALKCKFERAP